MEARDVERHLHAHVPLSRALGVRVLRIDEGGALLGAPLEPNVNDGGTGFGGSLSALGVLAGWVMVHAAMRRADVAHRLVIQHHEIAFTAPAEGALEAWAPAPDEASWSHFLRVHQRRGLARVAVSCSLRSAGRPVGDCRGRYVALREGS